MFNTGVTLVVQIVWSTLAFLGLLIIYFVRYSCSSQLSALAAEAEAQPHPTPPPLPRRPTGAAHSDQVAARALG
ncbi:hypothetical protein T492DRAFT_345836 [Pavlovales sp. CCMP2436]|nr:hypothetical protein T492DRAFT_345836 [Pavlovales sp. CCMP2436]